MALTKQTIIVQIEVQRSGVLKVRLSKQIVEGEKILRAEPHRFDVEPGADLQAAIGAVNDHLQAMGEEPVAKAELERVQRLMGVEHTPKAVKAYQKQQRAALGAARPVEAVKE